MDTILQSGSGRTTAYTSAQSSPGRSQALRVKRAVTDQIEQELYRSRLNKNVLANRMGTSRAAVQRLLDPDNTSITLGTLERVAQALNKRLVIEFS